MWTSPSTFPFIKYMPGIISLEAGGVICSFYGLTHFPNAFLACVYHLLRMKLELYG